MVHGMKVPHITWQMRNWLVTNATKVANQESKPREGHSMRCMDGVPYCSVTDYESTQNQMLSNKLSLACTAQRTVCLTFSKMHTMMSDISAYLFPTSLHQQSHTEAYWDTLSKKVCLQRLASHRSSISAIPTGMTPESRPRTAIEKGVSPLPPPLAHTVLH